MTALAHCLAQGGGQEHKVFSQKSGVASQKECSTRTIGC